MTQIRAGYLKICCHLVLLFGLCQAKAIAAESVAAGGEFTLQSTILKQQRRYQVALPERYFASQQRYAVLYIVDSDFQFEHVAAVARNMARMGKIPPLLVVGIATNGSTDYWHQTTWPSAAPDGAGSGGAAAQLLYLQQELIPLINQRYRSNGRQALAGYSMGGLLVLQAQLQNSQPYSAFLALSPSLWYDNYALQARYAKWLKQTSAPQQLFLSVANEQGMGVAELAEQLKSTAPATLQWQFKTFPEESHYSTAIPALFAGLSFIFAEYAQSMDQLLALGEYPKVLAYFAAQRQHWAGFEFNALQAYEIAKYLYVSKQLPQLQAFLDAAEQQFPGSRLELSVQLAKALLKKQQTTEAHQLLLAVAAQGQPYHEWQRQMALCYQSLHQLQLAKKHQQQAEQLALAQQLATWEYQELEPGSL